MKPSQHSASTKKSQRLIAFEQECRYLLQINTLFSTAIITYLVYKPKGLTDTNKANPDDDSSKTDKTNNITDKSQQSLAINNFEGHPICDYFKSIEWVKSIICSIKQEPVKLFFKPFETFEEQLKQLLITKPNTTFLDSISAALKDYQLHPYFELLHQQCQTITKVYSLHDLNDIIPELTLQIRLAASSHSFKQKLNQFTIRSTKNAAQLKRYCHQLNDLYPALKVFKLTINPHGYVENATAKDKAFILSPYRVADSSEYDALKVRHNQFIKSFKKQFGDELLVGYAWSIDFLLNKGYCLQILLFFEDSLLIHAKQHALKDIEQAIDHAWSFLNDHNYPVYQIKQQVFDSEVEGYSAKLATSMIQLTQSSRYLKFKSLSSTKTFGLGRISTQKRAAVKQPVTNKNLLLKTWSPLMATQSLKATPAQKHRYQQFALASLFINQNDHQEPYAPLLEINALEDLKQKPIINTVDTLINLTDLTRALVNDDCSHYQWIESAKGDESLYASELGKTLYYFLCQDLNAILARLSGLTLNAASTLFFETFMNWQPNHLINHDTPKDLVLYQALEHFIGQLRHQTRDDKKRSIFSLDNAHQKAIDKNYRLLKKYSQTLQRKYSALFIFQVEFSYSKACHLIKPSTANMFFASRNNQTTYNEVKKDRQLLFKQLNKQYGQRLAGFAWKLKYSQDKGFYHEWLLFFDEQQIPAASESIQLHSLWLGITQEKGSTHFRSCQLNKTKDYRAVIPKEQRIEQQTQFEAMLCSLTLVDAFVYFDPKTVDSRSTDRTFNRGHL